MTKKTTKEMLAKKYIEDFSKKYGMSCYCRIAVDSSGWEGNKSPKLFLDGDCLSELQGNGILGWKMYDGLTKHLKDKGYYPFWHTYSVMEIYSEKESLDI